MEILSSFLGIALRAYWWLVRNEAMERNMETIAELGPLVGTTRLRVSGCGFWCCGWIFRI